MCSHVTAVPIRVFPRVVSEVGCDHVEGGAYIGPEFQLGQVYDGSIDLSDAVVLYRPVYVCVKPPHRQNGAGQKPAAPQRTATLPAKTHRKPGSARSGVAAAGELDLRCAGLRRA